MTDIARAIFNTLAAAYPDANRARLAQIADHAAVTALSDAIARVVAHESAAHPAEWPTELLNGKDLSR